MTFLVLHIPDPVMRLSNELLHERLGRTRRSFARANRDEITYAERVQLAADWRATVAVRGAKIQLFDLATGRERATSGPSFADVCAAFSPDGKRLAVGGMARMTRVFDGPDGRSG